MNQVDIQGFVVFVLVERSRFIGSYETHIFRKRWVFTSKRDGPWVDIETVFCLEQIKKQIWSCQTLCVTFTQKQLHQMPLNSVTQREHPWSYPLNHYYKGL